MTAEVVLVERRYQVTVRARLIDAEARPVPYTRQQRIYVPSILELGYDWSSGDTEQYINVTIHGRRILVDGTNDGATETEWLWSREQWPDWVRNLVEHHRPPADAFVGSTP